MKSKATFWLIVQGVALTVAGFLAGSGMTFICAVRYDLSARTHKALDLDIHPPGYYAPFLGLMVAWLVIACVFAWRNRTRPGLALSAMAFAVFAVSARHVFAFAYPVCNAF